MTRTPSQNPRQDIHAVAKSAKVSIATVSRVINQKPSVRPVVAERVWKAIKKLNYHPNHGARAMVSGRSRTVGLIVSRVTNPFFPELIEGFERVAAENGFEILLSSVASDPGRVEASVQRMLQRNAEGVAIMTHGISAVELQGFAINGTPLVFMDAPPAAGLGGVIHIDYEKGFHDAVQHLAILGHRRIAFISGDLDRYTARLRQQAFLLATKKIGVTDASDICVEGDHTAEGGQRAMNLLLKEENRPTAVICSNDMSAIGALGAATEAKVKVPEQLSIIGFDDIQLTRFVSPPLTTIAVDRNALARRTFAALINQIAKPLERGTEEMISPTLVVRQSTTYASPANSTPSAKPRRSSRKS